MHLCGRDLDDTIFEINGLKENKKVEKEKPTIKICYRCKETNPSTGKFCSRCSTPLDIDNSMKIEEKKNELEKLLTQLLQFPDVAQVITKRLREIQLT